MALIELPSGPKTTCGRMFPVGCSAKLLERDDMYENAFNSIVFDVLSCKRTYADGANQMYKHVLRNPIDLLDLIATG